MWANAPPVAGYTWKFPPMLLSSPSRSRFRLAAVLLALTGAGFAAAEVPDAADKVSFNRDIRPILSDTCFQCHGPDGAKRKSGVRFDHRESATQPAKSGGTAIAPRPPEQSEERQPWE